MCREVPIRVRAVFERHGGNFPGERRALDACGRSLNNGEVFPPTPVGGVRMMALLLSCLLAADSSAVVRGQYVEARTCDVFTGSCFANADTGLTGKNAVLAWKVDSGAVGGVNLGGLGVVAVLSATDTLGLKQSAPGRSVLIVDGKATTAQRDALVAFAKAQAGKLLGD